MVSTSKILTVSYGTFSCTLEGFDDSFDTMKSIAEYFRDLAADDRYFGAEPPTPDAEVLARIAEKEIARRVDAHHEEGKIVLRADAPAPEAPPAAVPVLETPAAAPVEVEATPEEVMEPAQEDEPEVGVDLSVLEAEAEPEVAEEPAMEPEAVEEELATMEMAEPADAEDADEEVVPEVSLDEAESEEEPQASVLDDILADSAADEATPEMDVVEPDDIPDEVEPVAFEAEFEDVAEAPATPMEETSVSERLRRIRSVVAQGNADLIEDGYDEDEHSQDFLAEAAADLDAALAQDDSDMEAEVEPVLADPEPVEADLPDMSMSEEEEPEVAADILEEDDEALSDEAVSELIEPEADADQSTMESLAAQLEDDSELFAENDSVEDDDEDEDPVENLSVSDEDTLSQLLADAMPEDATADSDDDDVIDEALDVSMDDIVEVEEVEDAAFDETAETPLRARVIKMKRSDFEAAVAAGSLEEAFDDAQEDDVEPEPELEPQPEAESLLSAEDEADLQSELAAVEAELRETEDLGPSTPDVPGRGAFEDEEMPERPTPFSENRRRSAQLVESNEVESLSHLFDEAESQLDEPAANERRNAIQHLRAAVEATKAEHKAGSELRSETDENPYRSTLASVVRPRRSELLEDVIQRRARPERPAEARPAPLKLVAEQRVDTPREPVRPRRVLTSPLDESMGGTPSGAGSFSAFAEEIGASSLPELLEAAAAYMSDVEGRDQFSRPMLMGKLKEVEMDDFSREDGLRSFGHLLREGKLQKVKGGRFAVTETTEFRGKKRNVG